MSNKEKTSDKKGEGFSLKGLQKTYNDLLVQQPYLTNATQGAIITALGVITSQLIASSSGKKFDLKEVYVMAAINFFWITPVCMRFFGLLETLKGGILVKLLVDQFAGAPLINASIISLRLLLRGETPPSEIPGIVMRILPNAMMYAWLFWIPVRAFAMAYVPPMLQLLFNCGGSFVWTIIFALVLG